MKDFFREFLTLAKSLNSIGITPILFGSLGLSKLLEADLKPKDVDILVPEKFLKSDWERIKNLMEKSGYQLTDLREHEFEKDGVKAAFAAEEDLKPYAGVDYRQLEIVKAEAEYKVLTLEDYLKVYTKSRHDSYRKNKNNGKDELKIELIKEKLRI